MKIYYDFAKQRLVYIGNKANQEFWDKYWSSEKFIQYRNTFANKNTFFVKNTKKYLNKGNQILEGGCGRGDKVYSLQKNGFNAYGVDYAAKTVESINFAKPELNVTKGDVRKLEFNSNFFDGYWSLGVIEHFYEGYDQILKEMHRVIKTGGYLFLTAPAVSPLRRFKIRYDKYQPYMETSINRNAFYQFALDPKEVIRTFEKKGFKLIKQSFISGFKGLSEDVSVLTSLFRFIDKKSNRLPYKIIRKLIDVVCSPVAGHSSFYVFKKSSPSDS